MEFHPDTGFTRTGVMIAIAVVIIASVIFLPKIIDVRSTSRPTTTSALATALTASNANNYAIRKLDPKLGHAITDCKDIANVFQGGLPIGYVIIPNATSLDTTNTCTLTGPSASSASFKATGIN